MLYSLQQTFWFDKIVFNGENKIASLQALITVEDFCNQQIKLKESECEMIVIA
jgi:hypothetical protein